MSEQPIAEKDLTAELVGSGHGIDILVPNTALLPGRMNLTTVNGLNVFSDGRISLVDSSKRFRSSGLGESDNHVFSVVIPLLEYGIIKRNKKRLMADSRGTLETTFSINERLSVRIGLLTQSNMKTHPFPVRIDVLYDNRRCASAVERHNYFIFYSKHMDNSHVDLLEFIQGQFEACSVVPLVPLAENLLEFVLGACRESALLNLFNRGQKIV